MYHRKITKPEPRIKAMIKYCGSDPELIEVDNDWKALESKIARYVDYIPMWNGNGILIAYDSEGEENGRPVNLRRYQGIYFRGTLIFCRCDYPFFVSLTDEDIQMLQDRLCGITDEMNVDGIIV